MMMVVVNIVHSIRIKLPAFIDIVKDLIPQNINTSLRRIRRKFEVRLGLLINQGRGLEVKLKG
jgi:hypothetical protein